jgi:uncharacterized membrane protein YhdT
MKILAVLYLAVSWVVYDTMKQTQRPGFDLVFWFHVILWPIPLIYILFRHED